MAENERTWIRDPKALRALAHPLRWQLLELIDRQGTATATDCAREVGESVASCSYHLNMLAKYGYVEHAEGGQGREKPWRVVHESHSWTEVGMDAEGALASEAASDAFLDYEFGRIRERLRSKSLEPDDWRAAVGLFSSNDYLTAAELSELMAEVQRHLTRYRERWKNPKVRPEGARPVHFFLSASVAPGTGER